MKLRDLSLHDERARLFERLVSGVTETTALQAAQSNLAAEATQEQARVIRPADRASQLENQRRDVRPGGQGGSPPSIGIDDFVPGHRRLAGC